MKKKDFQKRRKKILFIIPEGKKRRGTCLWNRLGGVRGVIKVTPKNERKKMIGKMSVRLLCVYLILQWGRGGEGPSQAIAPFPQVEEKAGAFLRI